jgi:hypothetical protein
LSWGNAGGPTYYAVGDGTIKALLYWEGSGVGEESGPGGEPVVTPPGWFVVLADEPDHHFSIDAPDLESGMAHEVLVRVTDAAMDAATRMVANRLNADDDQ